MSYEPPPQRQDETPAQWALRVLNDTSHHIRVTDENRHVWLLHERYRNRPWTLLTPLGTFTSDRLHDRWIVPRRPDPERPWDPGPKDAVFHLDTIIWCSDADGWVAEYKERRP